MKNLFKVMVLPLLLAMLALAGCEVEKTEEGEMPQVDVEGGKLPEYDVEGPDVDIGTTTKEIEVPTVDVDMPDDDDDEVVDEDESPDR